MKESNIQTLFTKYNELCGVFELKLSKGRSIRFDSTRPHQIEALLKAKSHAGLSFKIPDTLGERFNIKKPFDCFKLCNQDAFVVVCFYTPRKPRRFYYIDIADWIDLPEAYPGRKSIREEELSIHAYSSFEVMK